MRCWFLSLAITFCAVGAGEAQETKKSGKDSKAPEFVEPTEVMGKTFKEWTKEIHAFDPSRREEAMKAVLLFGPNKAYEAVPEILKELSKHKLQPVDLSVRVNGTMALST